MHAQLLPILAINSSRKNEHGVGLLEREENKEIKKVKEIEARERREEGCGILFWQWISFQNFKRES